MSSPSSTRGPRDRKPPSRTVRVLLLLASLLGSAALGRDGGTEPELWRVYRQSLAGAKYVDLTHTVNPHIPVWAGFARSTFSPAADPKTGKPWSYKTDGFEATHYDLGTDQLGTQLDPPAHWNPVWGPGPSGKNAFRNRL